eukprot:Nk52_evm3s1178 gene=Nk52_evmTU3s1178
MRFGSLLTRPGCFRVGRYTVGCGEVKRTAPTLVTVTQRDYTGVLYSTVSGKRGGSAWWDSGRSANRAEESGLDRDLGGIRMVWGQCRYYGSSVKPPRSNQFKVVDENDLSVFSSILSGSTDYHSCQHMVLPEGDAYEQHNEDWQGKHFGHSACVLKPTSTEQVSQIMAHCYSNQIAVVPQGGNTGLVGGSVPVHDEVIVNLSLMDKVLDFNSVTGVVHCESGCILEKLDAHLQSQGFIMPLELGSKGSCEIGGNLSTNAGGLRLLRYGSLHANILGLEVVLPDGKVVNFGNGHRKDNTGYHLQHLFVGGEGTLGIITKCYILAPPLPRSSQVLFLGCSDFKDVIKVFGAAKKTYLNEILSACEFLDEEVLSLVERHLGGKKDDHFENPQFRSPLTSRCPFYVLLETSGCHERHDSEKVEEFVEAMFEQGLIVDGVMAKDMKEMKQIWEIRESCALALKKSGAVFKYDVSIPLGDIYSVVEDMRKHLADMNAPVKECVGYGHLGDGNLHLNVTCDKDEKTKEATFKAVEPQIYELVRNLQGSVSAEHGIGHQKTSYLVYTKSEGAIDMMRQIKQVFDPKGIMNPYKILPDKE